MKLGWKLIDERGEDLFLAPAFLLELFDYDNSSSSAFASRKSVVANPSVNML
jgi:hypothetical protein